MTLLPLLLVACCGALLANAVALSHEARCLLTASSSSPHCFASHDEYLTPEDERVLKRLRSDKIVSIHDTQAQKQASTIIFELESGMLMKCKNARASFYKVEGSIPEVFAFYFDRLLHGGHVLPSTILSFSGARWKKVRDDEILISKKKGRWSKGDPLVCTQWIEPLDNATLPLWFKQETQPINVPRMLHRNLSEQEKNATELWGHVVAFDYILGIHDRITNSLNGGAAWMRRDKRKKQINSLSECRKDDCLVDNAYYNPTTHKLVLVDNNSAMFYDNAMTDPVTYILDDYCVFPASLVELLHKHDASSALADLRSLIARYEPESPVIQYGRSQVFMQRYVHFMRHLEECRQTYGAVSF